MNVCRISNESLEIQTKYMKKIAYYVRSKSVFLVKLGFAGNSPRTVHRGTIHRAQFTVAQFTAKK
jgi:hypothetical protein